MERKRQITQDLNKIQHEKVAIVGHTLATYAVELVRRDVQLPSRVEGRTVAVTRDVPTLVPQQQYESTQAYLAEWARRYREQRQVAPNNWTIDDVPAEVRAASSEAMAEAVTAFADIQAIAEQQAAQPIDRMTATEACSKCEGRHEYYCHTCGDARRLYTYPLVYARDAITGESLEVPFDVALYMAEHPSDDVVSVKNTLTDRGELTSSYQFAIAPRVLSQRYVEQATNGEVAVDAEGVVLTDNETAVTIELANWTELPYGRRADGASISSSEELIATAQRRITYACAERVDDTDYNQLLHTVQQSLGERGLRLFYEWRAGGMGDWDVIYSAHKNEAATQGAKLPPLATYSGDAYFGLVDFARKLDTALTDE